MAPDRARALARHVLGVRHAAAAIDVRAFHRRPRRSRQCHRAQLDARQYGARRGPGHRGPAAGRHERGRVLCAECAVVRRRHRRDLEDGVARRRPGFRRVRVVGELDGRGSLCVRTEARADLARARGVAGVDHFAVLVADARVREGHLRWRPAHARLPAVGGRRGCARFDTASCAPGDRARPRARDHAGRGDEWSWRSRRSPTSASSRSRCC